MVTAFLAGIGEEVLFRGYIQHLLTGRIGAYWSVGITSVFFSLAHMGNPGYNWISALNIVIIAVIFSLLTLRTGRLYPAMAMHISWNLFQGYVYGVAVSGSAPHGLYTVKLSGQAWLTGGVFGLEGSLAVTLILLVALTGLLWLPPAVNAPVTAGWNSRLPGR
ncbi:CAAX amino terminal protease self- immunity [compost metagenome]